MKQAKCIMLGLALCCEAISLGATTPLTFTFSVSNNAPQSVSQPNSLCVSKFNLPSTIDTPMQIIANASGMSCPSTINNGAICSVSQSNLMQNSGNMNVTLQLQAAVPTKKTFTYQTYKLCSQVNNLLVLNASGSSLSSTQNGTLNVDSAVFKYFANGMVPAGSITFKYGQSYSAGNFYYGSFAPWASSPLTFSWPSVSGVSAVCSIFNNFIDQGSNGMGWVLLANYAGSTYTLPDTGSPNNLKNMLALTQAMGCIPDKVQFSCSLRYPPQNPPTMKTNIESLPTSALSGGNVSSIQCYTGTTTQSVSQSYGLTGLGYVDSINALISSLGGNFTTSNVCPNIFTQPSASSTGWFSGSTPENIVQGLQSNCSFTGSIHGGMTINDIINQIGFNQTLNQTVNCTISSNLDMSCSMADTSSAQTDYLSAF